jgi:hypothetical protein
MHIGALHRFHATHFGLNWKQMPSSTAKRLVGQRRLMNMVTSSDLQSEFPELSMKLRRSVKLDHLFALTDHNALLQHAKFSVPARREGYTVDDNTRALVFAVGADSLWPSQQLSELQRKIMSFLLLMQAEDGQFHNLMDFSLRIIDKPAMGDHLGRAMWAAGSVINSSLPSGMKASARLMFDRALPWVRASTSSRTKAYACLGLHERLHAEARDSNLKSNLEQLADSLVELYNNTRTSDWKWFEGILSYDNARMSQALFAAYHSSGKRVYLDVAQETLQFLKNVTTIQGNYAPIGSQEWYVKGGRRAMYDQQPLEAGTMVEASVLAYKLTHSNLYAEATRQALGWFFGVNSKSVKVYDEATGACHDGINIMGLNENQGAESTVSFLLAAQEFIKSFSQ